MTKVTLVIEVDETIAKAAEEAERLSPGFYARALHYATMRQALYWHLTEREAAKLVVEATS